MTLSEKYKLSAFTIARIIANGLDIIGVLLFGAIGVLALGQDVEIPLVNFVLVVEGNYLLPLMAGVGIVFTLKTLFGLLLSWRAAIFLATVESSYSKRIIERIFAGGISVMKSYSRADTEWAVLRSSAIAFSTILGQASTLVSEATLAIGILVLLLIADVTVAMALILYLLLVALLLQLWSNKIVKEIGEEYSSKSVATNNSLDDLVSAYREVAIAGKLQEFIGLTARNRGAVSRAQARYHFFTSVPRHVAELGLVIAVIGLAAYFSIRDGTAESVGLLAVFAAGGLRVLSAMLPLLRAFQDLRFQGPLASSAQAILSDVKETRFSEESDEHGATSQTELLSSNQSGEPPIALEMEDVSFSYKDQGRSAAVVDHVSLGVGAGQIVALAGPSGAGKSTIAELILGLKSPSSGKVMLQGVPAGRFRRANPGLIGYVAQKPGLISGSIERNIVLGLEGEPVNQYSLMEAIEFAELGSLIDSLPEGIQTDIGKHRDAFSGGQLQRIGLARALYRKPKLVILDEATSALDAESESLVTQKMLGLRGQVTVVIIAHRLSSIQDVDKIFLVETGRIVASGSFEQLFRSTELMRRYAELMSISLPEE